MLIRFSKAQGGAGACDGAVWVRWRPRQDRRCDVVVDVVVVVLGN